MKLISVVLLLAMVPSYAMAEKCQGVFTGVPEIIQQSIDEITAIGVAGPTFNAELLQLRATEELLAGVLTDPAVMAFLSYKVESQAFDEGLSLKTWIKKVQNQSSDPEVLQKVRSIAQSLMRDITQRSGVWRKVNREWIGEIHSLLHETWAKLKQTHSDLLELTLTYRILNLQDYYDSVPRVPSGKSAKTIKEDGGMIALVVGNLWFWVLFPEIAGEVYKQVLPGTPLPGSAALPLPFAPHLDPQRTFVQVLVLSTAVLSTLTYQIYTKWPRGVLTSKRFIDD